MSGSSSAAEGAKPRPFHPLPALLAAGYAGWIWWLSSQSIRGSSTPWWSFCSNSFHLALFGGLAILLAETVRRGGTWSPRAIWGIVLAVLVYGAVDEAHQAATPGRASDPADVCVDVLGAVAAISFWWGVRGPGRLWPALVRSGGVAGATLAFNALRVWGPMWQQG